MTRTTTHHATALYRHAQPQLGGDLYLTDAGLETDMVFNHGFELPAFASHTLLETQKGRDALSDYFSGFLTLARAAELGMILDTGVWRAQRHFAAELGVRPESLEQVNHDSVAFAASLRDAYASNSKPILLSGSVGPRGDAYAPENWITADAAQDYHSEQLGWLADTDVDLITALTFTSADEAIGLVRAAADENLPVAVSFTVETDGRLPTGMTLGDAIGKVDDETGRTALYYMINCAHPSHILSGLNGGDWTGRIRGLRCNASCLSHAELDECETLDDGNPAQLSREYDELLTVLPAINVVGGCCGTDLRHITAIANTLAPRFQR